MKKCNNKEFNEIIDMYANHPKVLEMKQYKHHGITRYEHSLNVAYCTYKITKTLNMNYHSATKAAMLHDFFLDEVENENGVKKLQDHPKYAVKNAERYFEINDLERDIIRSHMFPVAPNKVPKYKESWIVDLVDDYVAIKERGKSTTKSIKSAVNIAVMIILTMIR